MLHLTDLRSIFFFFTSVCIHLHYIWVGKERWMNRKKKSIQVRRIGRGKGIRFPFSFQPYISQSSLLPITAKFSSYFLTNQKTKRKDCFPLFFSLWFLISCHFHPLPYPSSQPQYWIQPKSHPKRTLSRVFLYKLHIFRNKRKLPCSFDYASHEPPKKNMKNL